MLIKDAAYFHRLHINAAQMKIWDDLRVILDKKGSAPLDADIARLEGLERFVDHHFSMKATMEEIGHAIHSDVR